MQNRDERDDCHDLQVRLGAPMGWIVDGRNSFDTAKSIRL
jgi:hypothetical protein